MRQRVPLRREKRSVARTSAVPLSNPAQRTMSILRPTSFPPALSWPSPDTEKRFSQPPPEAYRNATNRRDYPFWTSGEKPHIRRGSVQELNYRRSFQRSPGRLSDRLPLHLVQTTRSLLSSILGHRKIFYSPNLRRHNTPLLRS